MRFGVVGGDYGAVLFALSVMAAGCDGLAAGVVGGNLRDCEAVEVCRDGEGLVGSEEEVVVPGVLAVFGEGGRRWDVGRLNIRKRPGERVKPVRGEERVNRFRPSVCVAEEGVAVVADGRGENELVVAAL